jgi:hypothetical protein
VSLLTSLSSLSVWTDFLVPYVSVGSVSLLWTVLTSVSHPLKTVLCRMGREHRLEGLSLSVVQETSVYIAVRITAYVIRCLGNDVSELSTVNVVTEPFYSTGRPLWLRCSGFLSGTPQYIHTYLNNGILYILFPLSEVLKTCASLKRTRWLLHDHCTSSYIQRIWEGHCICVQCTPNRRSQQEGR